MTDCHGCGEEGKDDELLQRPADLLFYAHLLEERTTAEIARKEYLCPRCGEVICSQRLVDGVVFNR